MIVVHLVDVTAHIGVGVGMDVQIQQGQRVKIVVDLVRIM